MEGSGVDNSLPVRIASLVHRHFDGLPSRSKPITRDDGTQEWIPMTGIVVVKGENTPAEQLTCIAVTTGAKCLSASQIPKCNGLVLHDWHAEILAMRAFNYWLLSECHSVLAHEQAAPISPPSATPTPTRQEDGPSPSPYIRRRQPTNETPSSMPYTITEVPPFELHQDITIYMYGTCAPCGDASMELCMATQDDPTPWEITPSDSSFNPISVSSHDSNVPNTTDLLLPGRAHFSRLGVVRRKPARADAESTKSKSCSDKIALKQVSSLLNHQTSLLVAPTTNVYLAGLILPEEEITRVGCDRCFGENGRMKALKGRRWSSLPSASVPLTSHRDESGHDSKIKQPMPQSQIDSGFELRFHPFRVLSIPNEQLRALWPFRKPKPGDSPATRDGGGPGKSKPGIISVVWVRAPTAAPTAADAYSALADNSSRTLPVLRGARTGLFENIVNGVRQGHRVTSPGLRGASALSRAKMWSVLKEMLRSSGCCGRGNQGDVIKQTELDEGLELADSEVAAVRQAVDASTYEGFKKASVESIGSIQARQRAIGDARRTLGGWVSNTGDEGWGLEVLVDTKKRKR